MKALKITLALMAIALLTVSGVQSEEVASLDKDKKQINTTNIDLLAHNKTKIKAPSKG